VVVSAKKVYTEFVSKKVDAECLAEFETDAEFDDVKEDGTRYCSKMCKKWPFNQFSSFRLLTCEDY
jgi:hypothetical protein